MQRWSSVLFIALCCMVRGALSYADPIYEIVEDDIPAEEFEAAERNHVKQDGMVFSKRDIDGSMPGVLRFGKRSGLWEKRESGVQKKEMPGVLRFGKRAFLDEKKSVPGVLRFGKRMEKREIPGVLRFGKRGFYDVMLDKRSEVPGVLRFGKRDVPGVLRFGKRSGIEDQYSGILLKKSVPGVLRFGRK